MSHWETESTHVSAGLSPFYKATRIQSWGLHLITLSNPNHLPKATSPNTIVGLIFYPLNTPNGG
jgi:hypothetical protein